MFGIVQFFKDFSFYMRDYAAEHKNTLIKGSISILSVSISFIESIELYIRIAGGLIGISIGILTIYRLVLEIKYKRKLLNGDN
jgi:hypothetical protein